MGSGGELVLLSTGNAPLGGGDCLVLTHGQASARLAGRRGVRSQVGRTSLQEDLCHVQSGLLAAGLQQDLAQTVVDSNRSVGGGVHAAGDRGVNLAQLNHVGDRVEGLHAGGTCHLDVESRSVWRQCGAEDTLTGEVKVTGVLQYSAGGDCAEALAADTEAGDETVDCGGQHVLVRLVSVFLIRTSERNAVTTDDDCAAQRVIVGLSCHVIVPFKILEV